jgi:SOS-response transcriptional repressor LexA
MPTPLTETQEAILAAIVRQQNQQMQPPSLREIAAEFGFSGSKSAREHVQALVRKGYLTDTGDGRRFSATITAVQQQLFTAPIHVPTPAVPTEGTSPSGPSQAL